VITWITPQLTLSAIPKETLILFCIFFKIFALNLNPLSAAAIFDINQQAIQLSSFNAQQYNSAAE